MDMKINLFMCMIILEIHFINGQINFYVNQMMPQSWRPRLATPLKNTFHRKQPESPSAKPFIDEWLFGVVLYYIDKNVYDENLKRRIQKAMSIVEESSCVVFKEQPEKPVGSNISWLHFTNPNLNRECSHDTIKGEDGDIIIVLGIECLKTRDVLHSVLHGLGFKDEVSHPHRDQYVRILWENIQPKYRPLFRVRLEKAPYKLVEYDPMSIMHFHDRAFSENGGLTIAPVMPGLVINPSDKLSRLDVMKLRLTFGHECNKRKVGDLIENCKNVLYNQNSHVAIKPLNADTDVDQATAEKEKHQQTEEEESNDCQSIAEEKLKGNGGDSKKVKNADGDENKSMKAADIEDNNKRTAADGGDNNKIKVADGADHQKEGRRGYPLHLLKYNTEKLH